MSGYAAFRAAFASAMRGGDPAAIAPFLADPADLDRFAVYRNTFVKGAIDALAAAYPSVRAALGREAFGGVGAAFVEAHPPAARTLSTYGAGFGGFLTAGRSDADAALILDLARLDRAWLEIHHAADAPPLTADDLAGRDPALFPAMRPGLAAAARLVPLAAADLALWERLRAAGGSGDAPQPIARPAAAPAAALLRRPEGAVVWRAVDPGEAAFLAAIAAGAPMGDAAEAAMGLDPAFDPALAFGKALGEGLLHRSDGPA